MSMAFEITQEDVENVLQQHGVAFTEQEAQELFDELDHGSVEQAALYGNDMDEQTNYAYVEIWNQLSSRF